MSGFAQIQPATPAAVQYTIEQLRAEGAAEVRIERIVGAMEDGYEWHPRNVGELRVGLAIATAKLDGRIPAIEALPYVGPMLREDCV